jgi:hypothetical protein
MHAAPFLFLEAKKSSRFCTGAEVSCLDFHTVLELNYHLVFAVDCHPFDKNMVGHRVESRDQRFLLHERS